MANSFLSSVKAIPHHRIFSPHLFFFPNTMWKPSHSQTCRHVTINGVAGLAVESLSGQIKNSTASLGITLRFWAPFRPRELFKTKKKEKKSFNIHHVTKYHSLTGKTGERERCILFQPPVEPASRCLSGLIRYSQEHVLALTRYHQRHFFLTVGGILFLRSNYCTSC